MERGNSKMHPGMSGATKRAASVTRGSGGGNTVRSSNGQTVAGLAGAQAKAASMNSGKFGGPLHKKG